MSSPQLHLGPGVPGRRSLGAESFEDFMGRGRLEGEERAELIEEHGAFSLLRYPLPGTPDENGRSRGAPRGAGTGWVRLSRYRGGGFLAGLRARFTEPRSVSFAARDWNLICHLRSFGVGTPEPMCVGSAPGSGFVRDSFLVTRELEKEVPLADWLAEVRDPDARRRGLEALGAMLARLFRSKTCLPELSPRTIHVGKIDETKECEASPVDLAVRRLPAVVLSDVRRGRILRELPVERAFDTLTRLFVELPERPTARETLRVFRAALGRELSTDERRRLWTRGVASVSGRAPVEADRVEG